jgi:hypothetical protein
MLGNTRKKRKEIIKLNREKEKKRKENKERT